MDAWTDGWVNRLLVLFINCISNRSMKYLVAQSLNKEKNDWISPIVLQLANDGIRE